MSKETRLERDNSRKNANNRAAKENIISAKCIIGFGHQDCTEGRVCRLK